MTTYEAVKRALGGGDDDYAIQTVASVISSAVSTTCFCPFDVRPQMALPDPPPSIQRATNDYKKNCIMHTPCMCGCVLDGTRVLQAYPVEWFPFSLFSCSPFHAKVISSRLMAGEAAGYTGFWDCLAKTVKVEGAWALQRGWLALFARTGPTSTVTLVLWEAFRVAAGANVKGEEDEGSP